MREKKEFWEEEKEKQNWEEEETREYRQYKN